MFERYTLEKEKVIKLKTKDLKKLSLVPNGDAGVIAKVYQLDESTCIKVFDEPFSVDFLRKIDEFSRYDYDFVTFPKEIVLNKRKYNAYTMRKINGMMFSQLDDSFNYEDILKLGSNLQKDIKELSEEGIRIEDCHSDNIMLDLETGKLVLIDIDFWSKRKKGDTYLVKRNFKSFDKVLRFKIFGKENLNMFNDFEESAYKSDYIDFYETFIGLFFNKEKVKTIGDIKEYVKKYNL